jgi:potassium-dependent mechanosensitive channel
MPRSLTRTWRGGSCRCRWRFRQGRGARCLLALLVVALGGVPAAGQGERGEEVSSIPIPALPARAEEAAALIRGVDEALQPRPEIDAIARRLPEQAERLRRDVELARRALDDGPTLTALASLADVLQNRRRELVEWNETLARHATQLEQLVERLTAMRDMWARTHDEARGSDAPAPVLARIDEVRRDLDGARTRVLKQRAAVLTTQTEVALALARSDEALGRIDQYRRSVVGGLLVRDSPPLWSRESLDGKWAQLPEVVQSVATMQMDLFRVYLQRHPGRVLLHAALLVALILAFRRGRRDVEAWVAEDPSLEGPARVLRRPYSAALVLMLLAGMLIYADEPRVARTLASLLLVVPAVRIVRLFVARSLVGALYGLGGLFVVDRIVNLSAVSPLLHQAAFLVEVLAFGSFIAWMIRTRRVPRLTDVHGAPRGAAIFARGARVLLAAALAALAAGLLGYMALARLIGGSAILGAYLAIPFLAAARAAEALVACALRVRPLALLAAVRRHRVALQMRARRVLGWLAAAGWAATGLDLLGVLESAVAAVRGALSARLTWGVLSVSLDDVLTFALTVWAAFLVSALLRFVLEEDVYPRVHLVRGLSYALSSVLHYAIILVGFWLAIAAMGVDLTKVTILAGAFGVGIGFGLQNVVNNFVSGLILLFERPIHLGDVIQMGNVTGEVKRIGIRSSTIRTGEGAEVIVPNGQLIAERVSNWTLSDRLRRVDIAVGVAYGTPPEQVIKILEGVARQHPMVLDEPPFMALFMGFGESTLNFELQAWTDRFERAGVTRSELGVSVYAALAAAGISIPFPQRDIHLRGREVGQEGFVPANRGQVP